VTVSFASLGSGSGGNATLVRVDDTLLLVDVGFSAKEIARRMGQLGVSPEQLSAVLISHEHSDHIKGLAVLARKYRVPVWLTSGTYRRLRDTNFSGVELLHPHGSLRIGDARISVFPVPHDAAEPCQYIIGDGHRRFAVATDMGCVTPHVKEQLSGVQALLLESNYDDEMLRYGPYPPALQSRIAGSYGHLSNAQAATMIESLDHGGLQHLLLGHLSENNNSQECAYNCTAEKLGADDNRLAVLARNEVSRWFAID
jgi:phosphoribosyl 1,2-cyclic phosphodiesterase